MARCHYSLRGNHEYEGVQGTGPTPDRKYAKPKKKRTGLAPWENTVLNIIRHGSQHIERAVNPRGYAQKAQQRRSAAMDAAIRSQGTRGMRPLQTHKAKGVNVATRQRNVKY